MSTNLPKPPRKSFIKVKSLGLVELIEGSYVRLHESKAATTGSAAFLGEDFGDAVGLNDSLDRSFAQTGDLAMFVCTQVFWSEWKTAHAGGFSNDQGHTQAAFAKELWVILAERFEFLSRGGHNGCQEWVDLR